MRDSGEQTSTTTSGPSSFVRPYLEEGVNAAQGMYRAGGTPVTPFSNETNEALTLAANRARLGSQVTDAAQNFATNTLSGGSMANNPFLQTGPNPYLDATFNRASGAVTNQVQSNFARSGRNVTGADPAGVAGDMYNDLAARIYGGAYETDANRRLAAYQGERGLQQGLIPFANSLANQDFTEIGQLANVGAQREALAREEAGQPAANLDAYLARLQGFPGSTSTSSIPMERNLLAGALGGAYLGNQVAPNNMWGTLGGAIGGLFL